MRVNFKPKFEQTLSSFCKLTYSDKVVVPMFTGISQFAGTISQKDEEPYVVLLCRAKKRESGSSHYNDKKLLEMTDVVAAYQYHPLAYQETLRQEAAEVEQQRRAAEAKSKLEAGRMQKRTLLKELKEREELLKQKKIMIDPFDPNQPDNTLDSLDIKQIEERLLELE